MESLGQRSAAARRPVLVEVVSSSSSQQPIDAEQEEEIDTEVEELQGLPSLRIKPGVVIFNTKPSAAKKATSAASPAVVVSAEAAAGTAPTSTGIIHRGRLCAVYELSSHLKNIYPKKGK